MKNSLKKRVALLGGAFDPIHKDHLAMAQACLRFDFCDELWFLPSPDLRWDKCTKESWQIRLKLIELAIQNFPNLKVCTADLEQNEYRGSFYLLSKLQKAHPELDFLWVIGADSYATLPTWRDPKVFTGGNFNGVDLMREFALICFPRPGYAQPSRTEHLKKGYKDLLLFDQKEDLGVGDCSSTKVRQAIAEGGFEEFLPQSVAAFIQEYKLYELN